MGVLCTVPPKRGSIAFLCVGMAVAIDLGRLGGEAAGRLQIFASLVRESRRCVVVCSIS